MRGLTARVVMQLLAAVVVELFIIDVAFLVWLQQHYASDVRLGLRAEALSEAVTAQRFAWLVLIGAGALTVVLATFFLRRAVLRPLQHLTDLVQQQQLEGLHRFTERAANDDLSHLGRAIVVMNQTIRDDQERIAGQVDELVRKNKDLAATSHQLVRAERLAVVGQLAAGLAHEVGNPLAVLRGYVDMLTTASLPPQDAAMALTRMGKELDRIHTTMRKLLDFSRVSQSSESGTGCVVTAVDHVRGLVGPQLRGIVLDVVITGEPPAVSLATDALTQVLLNLILNAVDAVETRGRIRVLCEHDEHRVTLHVDDSGKGVPKAIRTRIFEPFFTTKPMGKGTGLGLAVCERIVVAAGGDIHVTDSAEGGARFSVTLRVAAKGAEL